MGVIGFDKYKIQKAGASASRPPPSAPTSAGRARLLKAAQNLHKATLKQQAGAREFRGIASELGEKIKNLEKSAVRLNKKIGRIRIKPLSRSAKKLADTMDSFLLTRSS